MTVNGNNYGGIFLPSLDRYQIFMSSYQVFILNCHSHLYVDLSRIHLLDIKIIKTCSCPVNGKQTITKLSEKSTLHLTSQHKELTNQHLFLTSRYHMHFI